MECQFQSEWNEDIFSSGRLPNIVEDIGTTITRNIGTGLETKRFSCKTQSTITAPGTTVDTAGTEKDPWIKEVVYFREASINLNFRICFLCNKI
jgi:hypothetical protein